MPTSHACTVALVNPATANHTMAAHCMVSHANTQLRRPLHIINSRDWKYSQPHDKSQLRDDKLPSSLLGFQCAAHCSGLCKLCDQLRQIQSLMHAPVPN